MQRPKKKINYIPMPGMYMAFMKYTYKGGIFGSEFVGFVNFRFLVANIRDALRGVMNIPHDLAVSGFILNLKLNKSLLNRERGLDGTKGFFKTFFVAGDQNIFPLRGKPRGDGGSGCKS